MPGDLLRREPFEVLANVVLRQVWQVRRFVIVEAQPQRRQHADVQPMRLRARHAGHAQRDRLGTRIAPVLLLVLRSNRHGELDEPRVAEIRLGQLIALREPAQVIVELLQRRPR